MPPPDDTTSTRPAPQPTRPEFPARSGPGSNHPRLSFDPALTRRRAVDGAWWPESRDAPAELPGLVAALDSRPGVRVRRLSVPVAEWDDIPRRLTVNGARTIRVDWFITMPRHTISVTAGGGDTINLLVIPPGTAAASAQAAMGMATTSPGSPDDILAAAQQAPT
jgi:Family of unknown function (DUF5994)